MSQHRLGLFDTQPTALEIRLAVGIAAILFVATLCVLPFRENPVGEIAAFVPTVNVAIAVSASVIAALLYAQASVFRSRALTVLASGYVFCALLVVVHAVTFPGAFSPNGMLGAGVNTTALIAVFWRLGFPAAVILYAWLKSAESAAPAEAESPPARVMTALSAALAAAGLAALFSIEAQRWMPALFIDRREGNYINLVVVNCAIIALTTGAIVGLLRSRPSLLDLWLLVALAAWLFQALLNLPLRARFTVGWYSLFALTMASNLIVMIALIAESNRVYARLALATAARERERGARLTSMDAVAAAIAHEVGQPLAAVAANAAAGVRWLDRPRPNLKKAIESLREINASASRSFNIIQSIRAVFSKGPDWAVEFSLNDLVRETAKLLDKELAGAKVSLELSLDEDLPPVLANRVQIQQVLINLLTNAIQSLDSARGRSRRIAIRSVAAEGEKVLLEVSDSGNGMSPEDVHHVFDAFHTTKATGTGIGLSLCRTIVEEHGGRIWASAGEKAGATFHVQLPRSRFTGSASLSSL